MLDIQPRMSFDLNGLKNGCTKNSENSLKSKHSFKDKREVDFKLKLTRLKGPCLDFGFQYALIRNNRSKKFGVEYWAWLKFAVASRNKYYLGLCLRPSLDILLLDIGSQ